MTFPGPLPLVPKRFKSDASATPVVNDHISVWREKTYPNGDTHSENVGRHSAFAGMSDQIEGDQPSKHTNRSGIVNFRSIRRRGRAVSAATAITDFLASDTLDKCDRTVPAGTRALGRTRTTDAEGPPSLDGPRQRITDDLDPLLWAVPKILSLIHVN
jgi:hypothetical protein